MASTRKLLGISLACSAIACAADSALLNLVMPDARVLAGINIERVLASPLSKQLASQIQSAPPEIQQILATTGFDPTRDLKEVLIASTARGQNAPTLVMVRGSFDVAKFSSFAGGQAFADYEGVPILTHPTNKSSGVLAFLGNTIAIGGDLEQVRQAIHRRKQGASLGSALAAKIAVLSERYDAWIISTVSLTDVASRANASNLQQFGELLKSIQEVSGGIRFGPSMELAAELVTRSEKDAGNVRDALQFVSGFLAGSPQNPSGLKPDALKVTLDDRSVLLTLTITEQELKKAYELQMARNKAAAPAKPRPADTGLVIQSSDTDMGTVRLPASK